MVERTHTGGWMPALYEPIKNVSQKIADWFAPRSDAAVLAEAYEITMELPGVAPEDMDISVQDGMLIVTGEKHSAQEVVEKSYFFSEREYGAFQRAFRIPPDADQDSIVAEFKNGVLSVQIPKVRATSGSARKVAVRTS